MTVTLAIAVNRLARYLVPALSDGGRDVPTHEEARGALAELAGAAYKRLSAGVTPERVGESWPHGAAPGCADERVYRGGLSRARSVLTLTRKPGIPAGEWEEGWAAALDALDALLAAEETTARAYELGCDECGYPPPKRGQRQQHHGGCPSQGGA